MAETSDGTVPDPAAVRDLADFVEALRRLRWSVGGPPYRSLAKKVGPLLRPPHPISHNTVSDLFQPGRRRLDVDLVTATVRALGLDERQVAEWRSACIRVQSEAASGGQSGVYQQLPSALATFTGRTAEVERLLAVAQAAPADGAARTVAICAVEGMGGIGKTQLALQVAHLLVQSGRHADVRLYANLRGFDPDRPPADPATVLDSFLRQLGVPSQGVPDSLDERAAMFRDRMYQRSALVVLDNAADEQQVQDLIPAGPDSLVLITSRRSMAGLDDATVLLLDVLDPEDSIRLMGRVAGADRVGAEPEAARRVAELCGGLPLAISLAAARLRSRPGWLVADLADTLAAGRLDAIAVGRRALRPVFDLSYACLPEAAQRMFRLLGLHPGDDFTIEAAAALAGEDPATAAGLFELLQDENLVQARSRDRYEMHDLLRRYALELCPPEGDPQRQAAQDRLVEHYLHLACHAAMLQFPARDPVLIPLKTPPPAVFPMADAQAALQWFEAELRTLLALISSAAAPRPDAAWQLAWSLVGHCIKTSRYREMIETQTVALEAAEQLGDLEAQAYALDRRHLARSETRDLDGAEADIRRAAGIYRGLGDRFHESRALSGLAAVNSSRGDHAACLEQARSALEISRALSVDSRRQQARNLNLIGWSMAHQAEAEAAVPICEEALALFEEVDDVWGQATALDSLGYAYGKHGEYPEAVASYQRSLDLRAEFRSPMLRANTLLYLGDLHRSQGDEETATEAYEQALSLVEGTDLPQLLEARQRLSGTSQG